MRSIFWLALDFLTADRRPTRGPYQVHKGNVPLAGAKHNRDCQRSSAEQKASALAPCWILTNNHLQVVNKLFNRSAVSIEKVEH